MKEHDRYPFILSLGHFTCDVNQGALASLLPFLIAGYGYDYAAATALVMVYNMVSSVVQPAFGQLADRKYFSWMMPAAVAAASGGLAFSGFCSNYWLLCLAVMAGGAGVAMFHPVAALVVNRSTEPGRHGRALSIFSFGGSMGFALGPVIMTTALSACGMYGTLVMLVPFVLFLIFFLPRLASISALMRSPVRNGATSGNVEKKDDWAGFFRLCVVLFTRSVVYQGLNTFIVLYWVYEFGAGKAVGSASLSLFFFAACAGTLLGGRLADRYGSRTMLRWSLALMIPPLAGICLVRDVLWATALLVPLGMAINLGYSSIVVLGQRYLPHHMGLASGITLGVSITIGGMAVPMLGRMSDLHGLATVLPVLAVLTACAFAASLFLKRIDG